MAVIWQANNNGTVIESVGSPMVCLLSGRCSFRFVALCQLKVNESHISGCGAFLPSNPLGSSGGSKRKPNVP